MPNRLPKSKSQVAKIQISKYIIKIIQSIVLIIFLLGATTSTITIIPFIFNSTNLTD
jgi:hypothetical protein